MMTFLMKARKLLLKRWAQKALLPSMRVRALRWCGFSVGRDVYIAEQFIVVEELTDTGNLTIGDRVSIAPRVTVVTSSHPNNSRIRSFAPVQKGPVVIAEDAWIGAGAVILPGVTIGRGAVVGAKSVVSEDVPELTVVAGSPAKSIKKLEPGESWS